MTAETQTKRHQWRKWTGTLSAVLRHYRRQIRRDLNPERRFLNDHARALFE